MNKELLVASFLVAYLIFSLVWAIYWKKRIECKIAKKRKELEETSK